MWLHLVQVREYFSTISRIFFGAKKRSHSGSQSIDDFHLTGLVHILKVMYPSNIIFFPTSMSIVKVISPLFLLGLYVWSLFFLMFTKQSPQGSNPLQSGKVQKKMRPQKPTRQDGSDTPHTRWTLCIYTWTPSRVGSLN